MIFTSTRLAPVTLIDLERREDERGFFARSFCTDEFSAHGLEPLLLQANVSYNRRKGTLRGLHFQRDPHAETKLVRCTRGAIFDVAVDVRLDSPTYGQWIGEELTADNRRMLYVPRGFAHGFLTLTDSAEVTYQASARYAPGSEGGFRFDDPAFNISWPAPIHVVSAKDQAWAPAPVLTPAR